MIVHGFEFIFLTAKKREPLATYFLKKKQHEQGTQSNTRTRVSCVRTRTACQ
jgi:hypothetical protein